MPSPDSVPRRRRRPATYTLRPAGGTEPLAGRSARNVGGPPGSYRCQVARIELQRAAGAYSIAPRHRARSAHAGRAVGTPGGEASVAPERPPRREHARARLRTTWTGSSPRSMPASGAQRTRRRVPIRLRPTLGRWRNSGTDAQCATASTAKDEGSLGQAWIWGICLQRLQVAPRSRGAVGDAARGHEYGQPAVSTEPRPLQSGPPPGWYRDADDPSSQRWWDGVDWTNTRSRRTCARNVHGGCTAKSTPTREPY